MYSFVLTRSVTIAKIPFAGVRDHPPEELCGNFLCRAEQKN